VRRVASQRLKELGKHQEEWTKREHELTEERRVQHRHDEEDVTEEHATIEELITRVWKERPRKYPQKSEEQLREEREEEERRKRLPITATEEEGQEGMRELVGIIRKFTNLTREVLGEKRCQELAVQARRDKLQEERRRKEREEEEERLEQKLLEKERRQKERRQIQIASRGPGGSRTWNVSIDGNTTDKDIQEMAEGLSRTKNLKLEERMTDREKGKYAFRP
jgi:hypothetical protein